MAWTKPPNAKHQTPNTKHQTSIPQAGDKLRTPFSQSSFLVSGMPD
ncbi:MAG TPA: hypothetical protein VK941_12220 [Gillisia sp.]|nr:hypothetical protein [Gillisia sp.]